MKLSCTILSLGCPKNLVDSEQMLGRLESAGYPITHDPDEAEVIIVNTCGFLETSRKESYEAIDEMCQLKQSGKAKFVLVSGCLVQLDKSVLMETCKEVDAVLDVFSREAILETLHKLEKGQAAGAEGSHSIELPILVENYQAGILPADMGRHSLMPEHVAYMKIAEGCNRNCSFCLIPQIRGQYISKPIETCVEEAKRLADSGVKELVLLAQDTSFYGADLYGKPHLAQLLQKLDKIEDLNWIRVMYLYPLAVDDYLIDTMANAERVLPYVDMPLQHIDNEVLKQMNRGVSEERVRGLLDKMREKIEGLVMRTTLISGFPGETKTAHKNLVKFLRQQQFDHVGVFEFSAELGTEAAKLPNQVDLETIHKRSQELMEVQAEINFQKNEKLIGSIVECTLDMQFDETSDVFVGRTWMDAPDVDGIVYVSIPDEYKGQMKPLYEGEFLDVEIVDQQEYDLVGIPASDF